MPDDVEVAERALAPGQQPVVDALPVEDVEAGQPASLLPGSQGVEAHGALCLLPTLADHHKLDAVQGSAGLSAHLALPSLLGVEQAEPLDVVEEEPGQGDHHQDDEGDGDKHHRPAAVRLQPVLLLLQVLLKETGMGTDAVEVIVASANVSDAPSPLL